MPAIVSKTEKNSIAHELEIQSGDEILSIDEQKMSDMIDYNFLCKSELVTIEIKKINGEIEVIEIEKDFDDDLGIIFESAVFDKVKPCCNKCIFCFVDQQPEGLRETLYIKDDDYRLSYLQGTYITLTNLSEADKKRIEKLRLGPLYISVHTTNPELRVKMLKNPKAADILKHLKWLEKIEIPIHAQIVLCPKYNDGEELKRTLFDLKKLKNVVSIAIVPVGITKFQKGKLYPVTKKIAIETIKIVDEFINVPLTPALSRKGRGGITKSNLTICCSDEFFSLAEANIPPRKYYGNFSQLEDGVGALRLLLDDFGKEKKRLSKSLSEPKNILFATSKLAEPAIKEICTELNKVKNLKADYVAVKSDYWGENITVAGLITSEDLINSVMTNPFTLHSSLLTVIIPSVMLRPYTEDFLDGKTLDYVKEKTGFNFIVINDFYSTKEIIEFIMKKSS
ncbi:MAG TPA: DUF512 domain-containing protein [Candidatus Gastranaerophilaceae bacterium]|nr:DUF512 domain-containing protein [Candidatus Gastranaerophilaceae bacterium]HPT41250.1 DUF512 domain-containing protein [Candidatus Gastranaerophilaceae bacterium]